MTADGAILQVRGLRKNFPVDGGRHLVAVDGVSLDVAAGETLALVGESGSGKSTVARCIVRLIEPSGGDVVIDGKSILPLQSRLLAGVYRRIQMVFQDPNASLNPRMNVRQVLDEPLRLHLDLPRAARTARVRELVEMVGLGAVHLERYPHELSGGQRQRVGIARAIAVSPDIVILDEPTSSLDVSVRGQILDLLLDLQRRLNLAYLFISHDLQVVRHVADRVAVMYLGGIVEIGPTHSIFGDPRHPYTRALLSAAPVVQWGVERKRLRLKGEISSPIDPPDACRLVGRCPLAQPACAAAKPALIDIGHDHAVACPVVVDGKASFPSGDLPPRLAAAATRGL
jgi:oligopeptide/dipeptide ABC transporter ATP-binding protein